MIGTVVSIVISSGGGDGADRVNRLFAGARFSSSPSSSPSIGRVSTFVDGTRALGGLVAALVLLRREVLLDSSMGGALEIRREDRGEDNVGSSGCDDCDTTRTDFRRLLGGGVTLASVNISSFSKKLSPSAASATVCRVMRRLLFFCFGGGGASSTRSSDDFRRD